MKLFSKNQFVFLLIIASMIISCGAYKKIVYVQGTGQPVNLQGTIMDSIPAPILKIGDLLVITVNSSSPEIALPFNLPLVPSLQSMSNYDQSNSSTTGTSGGLQNYLIDTQGNITFPVIGTIHAVGMTKNQLSEYIKRQIYPRYMKEEPIISIRYANYKVSVLGEVAHPGVFYINNEKINIFETLALAGDMTIYGQRKNVLLIRESAKGERKTYRLNLTDPHIINSPYFYLQQNDVLYIQPNNPKSRATDFSTAESFTVSVVGILISMTSLIITITKIH
jgi:polysaccharide export outer membrane protein